MRRQHERLLGSLRFPEMNQRRNAITDPEDASFERVFRSYERTAHSHTPDVLEASDHPNEELKSYSNEENSGTLSDTNLTLQRVDNVWQSFVSWLRSDEPLFWIQGKPGSGKSTLIKHIVMNDATRQLLGEWSPDSRVISHYFYLIGTPLQNNITGFYSSLVYQLLEDEESLTEETIRQYPVSTTKHHIGDWSASELQKLLHVVLDIQVGHGPLCVFIDGLDEYADKDGQHGLLNRLQAILQRPKIKMCVSSRPEPNLLRRLGSQPNLKLQDLTWPEMELYTDEQLRPFSEEDAISEAFLVQVKRELPCKAQGVFLWLVLALRSLIDGIRNRDSEHLLTMRVDELPPELEDLYEAMWTRANKDTSIYYESAARYFQIMLHNVEMKMLRIFSVEAGLNFSSITLFEMAHAKTDVKKNPLDLSTEVDSDQDVESYADIEREVRVRCAGLLEIVPGQEAILGKNSKGEACIIEDPLCTWDCQVRFVHRTAHDFLGTGRLGRSILSHSNTSSDDIRLAILRSWLCLARFIHQEHGFDSWLRAFMYNLTHIPETCTQLTTVALDEILNTAKLLYEEDILTLTGYMKSHFLSVVAEKRALDTWLLAQLDSLSADTATVVLGDLWPCPIHSDTDSNWSGAWIVRRLLSRGADPFSIRQYYGRGASAYSFNAIQAFISFFCTNKDHAEPASSLVFSEVIEAILEATVPFTDHRWLIWISRAPVPLQFAVWAREWDSWWSPSHEVEYDPIFEVSTTSLLNYALGVAEARTPGIKEMMPRAREVLEANHSEMAARPCLRYIGRGLLKIPGDPSFYEIINQEPFEEVAGQLFDFSKKGGMSQTNSPVLQAHKRLNEIIHSSKGDIPILKEIQFEDIASKYGMELVRKEVLSHHQAQEGFDLD